MDMEPGGGTIPGALSPERGAKDSLLASSVAFYASSGGGGEGV